LNTCTTRSAGRSCHPTAWSRPSGTGTTSQNAWQSRVAGESATNILKLTLIGRTPWSARVPRARISPPPDRGHGSVSAPNARAFFFFGAVSQNGPCHVAERFCNTRKHRRPSCFPVKPTIPTRNQFGPHPQLALYDQVPFRAAVSLMRTTSTTSGFFDHAARLHARCRLDRHRGGGHPPTPATPPCVRVRTRRFELVTPTPPRIRMEARAI
jgi:hypothetical protein